jgi:hypothetical protein
MYVTAMERELASKWLWRRFRIGRRKTVVDREPNVIYASSGRQYAVRPDGAWFERARDRDGWRRAREVPSDLQRVGGVARLPKS